MKMKLLALFLSLIAITANAKPCTAPPTALIEGNYSMIGRMPDSEKMFSGSAVIKSQNDKSIQLITKMGKNELIWRGKFRSAEPGDGCVLALDSREGTMACLVSTDLDNYARITCLSQSKGKTSKNPGLIALFAR